MNLKIGDLVEVGGKETMEVYEATSRDGSKYLALRSYPYIPGMGSYNGDVRYFLEGCWGGITKKL